MRKLVLKDWTKANDALQKRFGGSKYALHNHNGVSRTTLDKFFHQEPLTEKKFRQICFSLGIEWTQVGDVSSDSLEEDKELDLIVQKFRVKISDNINQRCGMMRILDMNQPIELSGKNGIYTDVNILEKITGSQRLEIIELMKRTKINSFGSSSNRSGSDRSGSDIRT